jgi:hypothetical protein
LPGLGVCKDLTMSRYRGQKALYEVIGRSRSRTRLSQDRSIEPLRAPDAIKEKEARSREAETDNTHNEQIRWEPRAIQFNSGRIELLLPYPVVFILALAVLIVILAAFKLGQSSGSEAPKPRVDLGQQNSPMNASSGETGGVQGAAAGQTEIKEENTKIVFDGTVRAGNAILIQEYGELVDLVPVKRFFAEGGIATEIIGTGTTFFLVTKERFAGNPDKEGSPGFLLKQRIIELGTKYQAPLDRARFAGFGKAYGMYFKEQFKGEVVNVD